MAEHRVDLDAETVLVGERWFKKDELAQAIKAKLDAGDFNVVVHSQALERLHGALASARVLAFRVEADVASALEDVARIRGVPLGQLLRDAVNQVHGTGVVTPSSKTIQVPTLSSLPAIPSAPPPLQKPSNIVVSSDIAPDEHANAIALTPKSATRSTLGERK